MWMVESVNLRQSLPISLYFLLGSSVERHLFFLTSDTFCEGTPSLAWKAVTMMCQSIPSLYKDTCSIIPSYINGS